jgi:hypothetical protein
MLAKATSCAVVGLDATPVEVEVDTARGLFGLTIVGLPDAAVLVNAWGSGVLRDSSEGCGGAGDS